MNVIIELAKLKRIISDEISIFEKNITKRYIYQFFYSCILRLTRIEDIRRDIPAMRTSIRNLAMIFHDPIVVTLQYSPATEESLKLKDIIEMKGSLLDMLYSNQFSVFTFGEETLNIWYPLDISRRSPHIVIVYQNDAVLHSLKHFIDPHIDNIEYIHITDFPDYYKRIRFNFEAMFLSDRELICDRGDLLDLIELSVVPINNEGIASNDIYSSISLQNDIWRRVLPIVSKSLVECIRDEDFARVFNIYRLYLRVILKQLGGID
jgi:hypothetical protein